ncbi:PA2779 family protein [Spectribacter hydrogenoxidans]|uniref:PA2779 family protein n=1 Tax=Spectribacter hydrogenoxidans TaxID=3075608 RepID=A0ABU3C4Q3_9GAMM|nr:PA2779 family protein [Salinisphaera sp. W335]MDT0636319.1 PA2779 family protein [Salinisphaera sp. W335]
MNKTGRKPFFAWLAVFAHLVSLAFVPMAQAEMVGTGAMLDEADRAERVAEVRDMLGQERVAEQMVELGVDPAAAQARVASLTDAELAQMQDNLESLPAGGSALAVLGVVFLVLLVLELVGVTNVFSRI